jgi:hypothetical protein
MTQRTRQPFILPNRPTACKPRSLLKVVFTFTTPHITWLSTARKPAGRPVDESIGRPAVHPRGCGTGIRAANHVPESSCVRPSPRGPVRDSDGRSIIPHLDEVRQAICVRDYSYQSACHDDGHR